MRVYCIFSLKIHGLVLNCSEMYQDHLMCKQAGLLKMGSCKKAGAAISTLRNPLKVSSQSGKASLIIGLKPFNVLSSRVRLTLAHSSSRAFLPMSNPWASPMTLDMYLKMC